MKRAITWSVLALVVGLGVEAKAAVKPNPLFTDGAVLQRGIRVSVWGTADNGEKVTVRFRDQKVTTTAENGKWQVWLKPLKAGGPDTLTLQGSNTVELKDMLVGEVWIASGQSNMEWPLRLSAEPEKAIAESKDPMLRLYTVQKKTSETPLTEVTSDGWHQSAPETVPNFSAVAYFFGKKLRKELGVPVGLINTSWGGTYAEAWTSRRMLEAEPDLRGTLADYKRAQWNYPLAVSNFQRQMADYQAAAEKAKAEGTPMPKAPNPPGNPTDPNNPNRPSVLYNAMIAPLIPYGIKGAICYQGESNAGRAYTYQTLFPTMIRNWRQDWGEGDFPFLFVQLAPFMAIQQDPKESAWAELREAQRLTDVNLTNTGMAVITDVGDEKDIHPRKKQQVGERLALSALAQSYGKDIAYSGPTFRSMEVEGNRVVLHFDHANGGLTAKDGPLKGFIVAGEDRKCYNAQAEIQGDRVIVTSPQVARPTEVRFGWADYPVVNLYNGAGLPASPFRTDDFPMVTQPK